MKRFILAVTATAAFAAALVTSLSPASAAYNISGKWMISYNGGAPCSTIVQQSYSSETNSNLTFSHNCLPSYPFYGSGSINLQDGTFFIEGTTYTSTIALQGTVSLGNHAMSGTYFEDPASGADIHGTFSGSGGNGGPKPASPTPTNTPTSTATAVPPTPTLQAVGGVAFDAPSGGRALDVWWLGAIAGAAFVALGGAAVYARKRT